MNYLYLWIDLLSLLGPLVLSFDKKVTFFRNWKSLFPSIILMMIVFIPWDIYFTVNGVWGFNEDYLSGWEFLHLPIEEWLFFIVVPYACVFIYECLGVYVKDYFLNSARLVYLLLAMLLIIFGLINLDRFYTFIDFVGAGLVSLIAVRLLKKQLGYSLLAFIVGLIPFLLVNGVLTGSFLGEPIVWYNNEENLGIRIFTIPVEDTIYFLFFFLLVLIPYEKFKASFLFHGIS